MTLDARRLPAGAAGLIRLGAGRLADLASARRPAPLPPDVTGDWRDAVATGVRRPLAYGVGAGGAFLLAFGILAATVPLSGAAVAPGVVAAAGRNRMVQHLEGGRVERILVREGDRVGKDQPLFEMDRTKPEAERNRIRRLAAATRLRMVRLAAERDGLERLDFSADLVAEASAAGASDSLEEQRKEFEARLNGHRQEVFILRQRLDASAEQVRGMEAQEIAVTSQSAVVEDEIGRKKALLDKGLSNRTEYSALLRSQAELVGQLGETRSGMAAARSRISESREMLSRLGTQRVETAVGELSEAGERLADLREQLRAAEAVLSRSTVRSPSDGVVVRMTVNAEGSVTAPGEALLELLPTSDDLVVEARIGLEDVDAVSIGKEADLRFTALNARTTPTVPARVSFVSADRTVDKDGSRPYYLARLAISKDLPQGLRKEGIYPGMPVEVYVGTGARTFAQYLLKPVTDSFSRAFREE